MEGSYVPKLAELGVLCMPASFVTYQRPQGLMQDCFRHWAESQYLFPFVTLPSFRQHGTSLIARICTGVNLPIKIRWIRSLDRITSRPKSKILV